MRSAAARSTSLLADDDRGAHAVGGVEGREPHDAGPPQLREALGEVGVRLPALRRVEGDVLLREDLDRRQPLLLPAVSGSPAAMRASASTCAQSIVKPSTPTAGVPLALLDVAEDRGRRAAADELDLQLRGLERGGQARAGLGRGEHRDLRVRVRLQVGDDAARGALADLADRDVDVADLARRADGRHLGVEARWMIGENDSSGTP